MTTLTTPTTNDHENGNGSEHENGTESTSTTIVVERTPLPKLQIFIVNLIQFAEPVTATVIYPFINEFVRETGITQGDEAKTGYYAGIIESIFFISETLTVVFWGRASDLFGRKPVLLLGPLGLALAMLGFGLSTSFWSLVYYRCLQGFFNGNIGVSKSIIAELTDKTNIGDAYALIPLMWSSGTTIGPMMGGVLTRPAARWPDTLGRIALLRDYPYFLPCAAASIIAFLSFAISAVSLKETLPSAKNTSIISRAMRRLKLSSSRDDTSKPLLSANPSQAEYGTVIGSDPPKSPPKLAELFVPDYVHVILNYGFLAFIDMSNAALIPLVYSTPIEYGGLGLDPYHIGIIMASYGFSSGVVQAIFLGAAVRKLGATKIYALCFPTYLVSFCCFPVANMLARQTGYIDWRAICFIVIQFMSMYLISPCYSAMSILVVQSAPDPRLMGSANGVAQMVTSGMRSFAPAIASSLFAISVARNLAGGYMVYIVLVSLVFVGMRIARLLPNYST